MTSLDIFELKKVISESIGVDIERIDLKTRIAYDLRTDADDAKDLLEAIEKRFLITFEKGFFEQYFNYEADLWGICNYFNKLFWPKKYIHPKDELTVEQIFEYIKQKVI